MSPAVSPELLATFRALQRTGSYGGAAAELSISVPMVKRRLRQLYDGLGITRRQGANRGYIASYMLRELPY